MRFKNTINRYRNVGLVYKIMGNYQQTVIHWNKYLQLNPKAPDAELIEKEIEKMKKAIK